MSIEMGEKRWLLVSNSIFSTLKLYWHTPKTWSLSYSKPNLAQHAPCNCCFLLPCVQYMCCQQRKGTAGPQGKHSRGRAHSSWPLSRVIPLWDNSSGFGDSSPSLQLKGFGWEFTMFPQATDSSRQAQDIAHDDWSKHAFPFCPQA